MITTLELITATGLGEQPAALWAPILSTAFAEFRIRDRREMAMIVSQCAHESQGYTRLRENLNYSAAGLLSTWPARFAGVADQYARQPERIANRAYANRLGNGGESSGDGWRYRGGGLIQLTGLDNYLRTGKSIGIELASEPALIVKPSVAARAACHFWVSNKIGSAARAGNIDAVSDLINLGRLTAKVGDANGYRDRAQRYTRTLHALGIV